MAINYYKVQVTRTNDSYTERNMRDFVTVRHYKDESAKEIAKRYFVEQGGIIGDRYEAEILEIAET